MARSVLTPEKTLSDLIRQTNRPYNGALTLRDGGQLRYVIQPYDPRQYAILTRDDPEGPPRHWVVSKKLFASVAAEQSPLSEGEYLQAFTDTSRRKALALVDEGTKVAKEELKGHKPAEENSLQTKEEAEAQKAPAGELPLIDKIKEIFNTNAWASFLEKTEGKGLVHKVTLPNGELLTQTTYVGAGDTLIPEVFIFQKTRLLICSRTVKTDITKELVRDEVTKSTKLSAGLGLSLSSTEFEFQPKEGDDAFSQGLPIKATATGPGLKFSGEMLKTYHRLTIRAHLRMIVEIGKYDIQVIPNAP